MRFRAVLGMVMVAVGAWLAFPYTVDDAYIVGRFSLHLAQGHGYAMNAGGQVTDGLTAPLFVLPGWGAAALGLDPVLCSKWVGVLCALGATWLWLSDLERRQFGSGSAVWAGLVLGFQPTYANWAGAGLETGCAALCLALAARGNGTLRSGVIRGASAGAMAWLRPELVPVALLLLYGGRRPAAARPALVMFAGMLGAVVAFRWGLFGDPIPLSVRAKPALFPVGLRYGITAAFMTTGGLGIPVAIFGGLGGRFRDRVLMWALALGWCCVVLAGGDWMPGFRLLAPLIPIYAVLVGRCVATAAPGRQFWIPWLLVVGVLALPILDYATRVPKWWAAEEAANRAQASLAPGIARLGGRLLAVDVGRLVYKSGVLVGDLGGVTEPQVADLPGGHLSKRVPEATVEAWHPSQILLHSRRFPKVSSDGRLVAFDGYPVEIRVASMRMVRNRFRVRRVLTYAPGYHYIWLTKRNGTE